MNRELEPVTVPQLRAWFAVHEENVTRSLGATFRGVSATLGWRFVSNATGHLHRLRRKGYVDWSPHEARTVVATSRPVHVVVSGRDDLVEIPNRLESVSDADRWIASVLKTQGRA